MFVPTPDPRVLAPKDNNAQRVAVYHGSPPNVKIANCEFKRAVARGRAAQRRIVPNRNVVQRLNFDGM
jgi:hypothetical protein